MWFNVEITFLPSMHHLCLIEFPRINFAPPTRQIHFSSIICDVFPLKSTPHVHFSQKDFVIKNIKKAKKKNKTKMKKNQNRSKSSYHWPLLRKLLQAFQINMEWNVSHFNIQLSLMITVKIYHCKFGYSPDNWILNIDRFHIK